MRAVVLDSDSLGTDLTLSEFESLPVTVTRYPTTTPEQVNERIRDAEIVLVNKVVLNADALGQAEKLRYVGVLATGTNNVDTDYCQQHGITVNNVDGYGTDSVAQHAMMLLLNLATSFAPTTQQVKQGDWSRSPYFCLLDNPVMELAGKHLIIVGYGTLGQRFAELARAFGMKVSVAARPGTTSAERRALDDLLPEADVVSLHCQLSPQTDKLINAERLAHVRVWWVCTRSKPWVHSKCRWQSPPEKSGLALTAISIKTIDRTKESPSGGTPTILCIWMIPPRR